MTSFWRIFSLELKSLVRSKTALLLTAAALAWVIFVPSVLRDDGTADGARELYVQFSLGGAFLLVVLSLVACATGTLARERVAKRLQLTMVRPVRHVVIVLGKVFAEIALGAAVLALSAAALLLRVDPSRPCNHVLTPILPTPAEEAERMYEAYLRDPQTPAQVRKAPKATVLRILKQRALDHYQTIGTNATVRWRFSEGGEAVRLRFTNNFEMRQELLGEFGLGGEVTVVSNMTQAVLTIPLKGEGTELSFCNLGRAPLMLRPRRDIKLLRGGDAFWRNLVRVYLELLALLTLLVSIGVALSAGLGRPVAMFVAFTALIVGEMSPSVVEQYPDELESKAIDRIGLYITRFAAEVTAPLSAHSPIAALAKDEFVERREVARLLATNVVVVPFALALLAAFVLPRKQSDQE